MSKWSKNKNVRTRSKVPVFIKIEDKESGAAAFKMVCDYYYLEMKREEARIEAGVTPAGTTFERLSQAFSRNGFDVIHRKEINFEDKDILLPAVVCNTDDEFAVLTKITANKYHIISCSSGRLSVSKDIFNNDFYNELIEVYPNDQFKEKRVDRSVVSLVRNWMSGGFSAVISIIILGILLIVPNVLFPASYKVFLDDILGRREIYLFRPFILCLVALMVIAPALTFFQRRLAMQIEMKSIVLQSSNFFRRLLQLPLPFFMSRHPGELGKRIPLNETLARVLSYDFPQLLINVLSIIVYVALMLQYNVWLTLMGVLFLVLNIVALRIVTNKRETLNQTIIQNEGQSYSVSMLGIERIETIKANATEDDFFANWIGYRIRATNTNQELDYTNKFLLVLPDFLKQLNAIIMLCMGALLVIYGHLTVGLLVAFQSIMNVFSKPMNDLLSNGGRIQDATAALTTLQDMYDSEIDDTYKNSITFSPSAVNPMESKLQGRIEIKNLVFGYDRYAPPLIDGFNLTIEPSESVAIIGRSGSGKSTIAKMLTGIHKQWSGDILFDGKHRTDFAAEYLANTLSSVDQSIFLFSGTVFDNISMWNSSIPHNIVVDACEDACIMEEINHRNGGLDSEVIEGGKNFSGGQRQRIEIARALVVNPSVLVLDEATSALDSETERILLNNLKKRACSVIVIAHRLSTIRNCDKIVVLDSGKVVQFGTHEEMLKIVDSPYYQLVNS
ncbi:MAG: peptidase domain-containing ABC transporter [Ignavibacteria bacterium]|jgi:NHLM bacteriocin system ABC transporter peptidase/ATP-binding protein|nr:peptidase domain-containing ABC transporter [Ignavibacteria bacterium]